jgi:hypothetical protein
MLLRPTLSVLLVAHVLSALHAYRAASLCGVVCFKMPARQKRQRMLDAVGIVTANRAARLSQTIFKIVAVLGPTPIANDAKPLTIIVHPELSEFIALKS